MQLVLSCNKTSKHLFGALTYRWGEPFRPTSTGCKISIHPLLNYQQPTRVLKHVEYRGDLFALQDIQPLFKSLVEKLC